MFEMKITVYALTADLTVSESVLISQNVSV